MLDKNAALKKTLILTPLLKLRLSLFLVLSNKRKMGREETWVELKAT